MSEQSNQAQATALARTCHGVSPLDDPCNAMGSVQCDICGKWFCAAHVEDESWHSCLLKARDEGGEG